MDAEAFDVLLAELRAFRTDHQTVEAKRARQSLPHGMHETLSAFANTEGGTVLLGVDEKRGSFTVTGVADARKIQSDLQALCAQMAPPLRTTIAFVDHPDGAVVVARIPAVPRAQRPCHLASLTAEDGSFIRVGDGDQRLTSDEVRSMLAGSSTTDYSAGPAPAGLDLDPGEVDGLLAVVRLLSSRNDGLDDDMLLRRWRVIEDDGNPTLAGVLTVGANPQATCAAARVTYRVLPRTSDPSGTRYAGRHAEGTVGVLLDDLVAWLRADLGQVQAVRDGDVFDVPPVPLEALREILSNALVHRAFAPGLRDRQVVVEVSADAVAITSPGNLFTSTDPELLGLTPMSGVRNLTLVRIGELLRTPKGARIVENQTSGIEAADRACRTEGAMPALFVDRPDSFQVLLVRGVIDTAPARDRLTDLALAHRDESIRLLAVATRLGDLRETFPGLARIVFDAALAARALAPCSIEVASARLAELEQAGLLRRLSARRRPVWSSVAGPASAPLVAVAGKPAAHGGKRVDRVPDLLAAIAASPDGVLTPQQIGEALGLTSPASRVKWITRSRDKGLIEPTKDNPFDPASGYRLTDGGRHVLTQRSQHVEPASSD